MARYGLGRLRVGEEDDESLSKSWTGRCTRKESGRKSGPGQEERSCSSLQAWITRLPSPLALRRKSPLFAHPSAHSAAQDPLQTMSPYAAHSPSRM